MVTCRKFGRSLLDESDAFYDFLCAPCSDNGKNVEALFQCIDCQVLYCNKCVTGHNKYSKNHNIVDSKSKLFGQAQRHPKTFANSGLPTDLCEEHHGEVIKMFCGQHDMVCCTVCIAVKHRSCDGVYYIPNIAKDLLKRQDNYNTKTSLEKVKVALQNLKSKMQDDMKQLSNQRDSILDEIEKFKKDLIRKVEELAKASIKEVQEKYKNIFEGINACSKNIGHILEDVDK
ncbi:tripartite motif-containing protein 66-like [Mercenaria mercenaria]|uniref:tripartite motif-containing protein 66-like n=1 Tax=Mercenaria mercenaria TaxID=6596 RepID=UPI00234F1BFB|nr:tripartite motif-containing protein 66-like [Mercenaria mercenaria]